MSKRQHSFLDKCITQCDRALRTLTHVPPTSNRPTPAQKVDEAEMSAKQKALSISLMRVNHTGEVCAQALYQGQGLTAKLPNVRKEMESAANEEQDHLVWCEQRLEELGGKTSVFNPAWYAMSFTIGAIAGAIGDKVSLGFVAATEQQVCEHLEEHLSKLPSADEKSRVVVKTMLEDEAKHAEAALNGGGVVFPTPVKRLMTASSKMMTRTSFYL